MTTRRAVHPIEARSYEIMQAEVDFSRWPSPAGELVKRMVHATADESFADTALVGDGALDALVGALRDRASIVCDANMVVAGLAVVKTSRTVRCYLDDVPGGEREPASPAGMTRSAAAIDRAVAEHPAGAIWVFGNAPTALARLLELHSRGAVSPAAVVGLPVGYVGAAEAKRDLWASSLRVVSVTNSGRRGGSAAASAVMNAAWRLAGL